MARFFQLLVQLLLFQVSVVLGVPLANETFIAGFPRTNGPEAPFINTTTLQRSIHNGTSSQDSSSLPSGSTWSCSDAFFDLNEKNYHESKVADFYGNWSLDLKEQKDYDRLLVEPELFVMEHLKWRGFNCGIGLGGCTRTPPCDHIQKTFPDDPEKTRKILFAIMIIENINIYAHLVFEATENTQTSLTESVTKMATTFYWERDQKEYDACQLKKWLINAAVQIGILIGMAALAPLSEAAFVAGEGAALKLARAEVKLATKALEKSRQTLARSNSPRRIRAAQSKVKKWNRMLENARKWEQEETKNTAAWQEQASQAKAAGRPIAARYKYGDMRWTGKGPQFKDGRALRDARSMIGGVAGNMATPYLTTQIEEDCVDHNPGKPSDTTKHVGELETIVERLLKDYRKGISASMKDVNSGTSGGNGTTGTVLAGLMRDGGYYALASRERSIQDPYQIEDRMTNSFTKALISEVWTTNLCYMICVDDQDLDCHNDVGPFEQSRFCPMLGIICQAQCWQNSKNSGESLELYGFNQVNQSYWNITQDSVLQESWDNYMLNGHETSPRFYDIQDTLSDPDTAFNAINDRPMDFRLPICMSESMSIRYIKSDDENKWESFPCTCGDELSDETADFFEAARINEWIGYEHLTTYCTEQLSKEGMGPAQFFIAMCELNVQWPFDYAYQHRPAQRNGSHPACDSVKKQARLILEWGTMEDVEERFCIDSALMTNGVTREKENFINTHYMGFGSVPTFEDRCTPYTVAWCENGFHYTNSSSSSTNATVAVSNPSDPTDGSLNSTDAIVGGSDPTNVTIMLGPVRLSRRSGVDCAKKYNPLSN
ncbi:MAG: hypothetical protein M1812_004507 [Candelaria pacifica]|nr:MAG: hypothetical protein M1812_004507 [Candelaria pacifica]